MEIWFNYKVILISYIIRENYLPIIPFLDFDKNRLFFEPLLIPVVQSLIGLAQGESSFWKWYAALQYHGDVLFESWQVLAL